MQATGFLGLEILLMRAAGGFDGNQNQHQDNEKNNCAANNEVGVDLVRFLGKAGAFGIKAWRTRAALLKLFERNTSWHDHGPLPGLLGRSGCRWSRS